MVWLSGWNLRKKLYINGTGQTAYPMMITVNQGNGSDGVGTIYCNGSVNSDFSDIRFTNSDGSTLISYWLDTESITGTSPNQVAKVWVKIPNTYTGSNSTYIYFYYNNSSAPSVSSGANTFLFFDDFPGSSIDASKWTVDAGVNPGPSGPFPSDGVSYKVSNGYWQTCYATSSDMSIAITSVSNIVDVNKSIDFDIQITSYVSGGAWNASQRYVYFNVISSSTYNELDIVWPYSGNSNYALYPINTSAIYNVQIPYVSSTQAKIYVNGTFWGNLALSGVPAKANFQARDLHQTSSCMNVRLYNVRIRPYTTSEPTWSSTISSEDSLTINSNPTGAEIWIAPHNGTYVDQGIATNNTLGIVTGTYDIKLTKGGYQDWYLLNQTFSAGQSYLVQATLSQLPGSLSISSTPSGAEIYLALQPGTPTDQGTITLSTGTTIPNLTPGTYNLLLRLTGYQDWTGTVTVTSNTTTTVSPTPTFAGSANITSVPIGAEIYLAISPGTPSDQGIQTPKIITGLTAPSSGATSIWNYKLTLLGYVDTSGSFIATAGQTITVPITFPGSLYITSLPTGAQIYIDGILQQ